MADRSDTNSSVPTVGGFFLPKRQLYRIIAVLSVIPISFYLAGADINSVLKYAPYTSTIHLFCFCSWFGCSIWVSFVAGLVMFKNLPRHVFGRLQAALFPRYFQYSVLFIGCTLINDLALESKVWTTSSSWTGLSIAQRYNLSVILVILLLNLLVFEPRTTRVMYQRHKVEIRLGTGHEIGQLKPSDPAKANDPELVALTKKFGALHGISTSLNLIAICLGTWHICWIAAKLQ